MALDKSWRSRWAELLKIAWPLVIANAFWNLQLTVDRVFLGQFSTEALGAATAVMMVFWTPMALLQQTAAYVTTFVAQYFGADEKEMIGPSVWQTIYVSFIGGGLFLLQIFGAEWLFDLFGHSEIVRSFEVDYFKSICYSALPTALVAAFSGFFTGIGLTRMVMWINAVGLVFNVIFDYLLIFGNLGFPALGIVGAGYATTLANMAAAIFGFAMVFRKKYDKEFKLWSGWRPNFDLTKRFIKYGVPSGLQWSLEGLAFTVFMIMVGLFPNGDASLAASGIAVTIMLLSILPVLGMGQAVMMKVGQSLGEKNTEAAIEATWSGVQLSVIYLLFMSTTFVFFPQFYISWFEQEGGGEIWQKTKEITAYLLIFVSVFTLFDSLNLNLSFALKGAGDTKFVSIVSLILPWPLMVLPTYLMRNLDGAIYWAWSTCSIHVICVAFIYWLRFRGGRWKSMSVMA